MNMISQFRQRVNKDGKAEITLEEFNQLQAEWIIRTKMEKDELTASPVEQLVSCGTCKYYKPDSEYKGLGDCKNNEVRGDNARIIIRFCEEFYIASDFACKFWESN